MTKKWKLAAPKKKRRSKKSAGQPTTATLIAACIQIALALTAWIDLARRPAALVRGRKAIWAAVIAINYIGPVIYFVRGRRHLPAAEPLPLSTP